ncbi:hypothetical protein MHM89_16650 [Pseudoalteromonas sp. CNC9-20]|uniref:hypothetical protein n=1 Tax=Pseudoalteromonas sp. CNC9-20 TaxID=2917750 RepID=UPI001EF6A15C|nr:hypothetical protein [Pseudoalteromonas sp. CNC9-20]MCG7571531.1 hypothetical protein [Pseudoalteromonas sp. CNC9-20]
MKLIILVCVSMLLLAATGLVRKHPKTPLTVLSSVLGYGLAAWGFVYVYGVIGGAFAFIASALLAGIVIALSLGKPDQQ